MQNVLEIFNWYKKNFRELPFRTTNDPYKIWLSEVILQQTQVNQGLKYYYAFLDEFPTVEKLAAAPEMKILKLWQGLGYYSRARNLLKTAQIVCSEHQGKFPDTYEALMKLPGIGDYTASAILSFAYLKPYPVLDGNVFRVIARLFDLENPIDINANRRVFKDILQNFMGQEAPNLFNNALMELGALVCRPQNPDCAVCPVYLDCLARKRNHIEIRPVKQGKVKQRVRYFNFVLLRYQDYFYLQKRTASDIWQNMYQLPLIESETACSAQEFQAELFKSVIKKQALKRNKKVLKLKHVLTHQLIEAVFYSFVCHEEPEIKANNLIKVSLKNYRKYPVPVLVEKFLLSL